LFISCLGEPSKIKKKTTKEKTDGEKKPKEGEDNSDDAGAVGGTSSSPDKGAVGGKRSADNGPAASSTGKVVFPTVITPADYLDSDEEEEETATKKALRQKAAAAAGGSATASGRPACRYGASCYRKNPHHFTKESHPGDADYAAAASGGDEEDDSRPECEYGTGCYRKNPDHRRRFKHTRKALPKRRAKVTHSVVVVKVADP
jgi:hypothetical protein